MVRLGNDGLDETWASVVLGISGTQADHEESQEPSVLGSRGKISYMVGIILLAFSTSLRYLNEMMTAKKVLKVKELVQDHKASKWHIKVQSLCS